MSTYNTDLDNINNICSLVKEIVELAEGIRKPSNNKETELIVSKALTIRNKAQAMENRLHAYRGAIEDLGFKRVRDKRRK